MRRFGTLPTSNIDARAGALCSKKDPPQYWGGLGNVLCFPWLSIAIGKHATLGSEDSREYDRENG